MEDSSTQPVWGLLLVISGPSGVGKTTIAHALIDRMGGRFSVSATTRSKRQGEVHGVDYIFLSDAEFEEVRARGHFLECARVFDRDWYGTPQQDVFEQLEKGDLVVLDIDVQGALQIRDRMPEACMIFIEPPSDAELKRRLQARGSEDEQSIRRRLDEAQHERTTARESGAYDHFVVNSDLDQAIEDVCSIVAAARNKPQCDGCSDAAHPAG